MKFRNTRIEHRYTAENMNTNENTNMQEKHRDPGEDERGNGRDARKMVTGAAGTGTTITFHPRILLDYLTDVESRQKHAILLDVLSSYTSS